MDSLVRRIEKLEAEHQAAGGVVVLETADGQEDRAEVAWRDANPDATPALVVVLRRFCTMQGGPLFREVAR